MRARIDRQISFERLHEIFVLDHATGQLFWKSRTSASEEWNLRHAGKLAGFLSNHGYINVYIDGTLYRAHQIVWTMCTGKWPVYSIDHRNGIGTNNIPENLREATHSEQSQNQKRRSDNTSGYTGVSFANKEKKWIAQIKLNGKYYHLGFYETPEQASDAYREAKSKLHTFQPTVRAA